MTQTADPAKRPFLLASAIPRGRRPASSDAAAPPCPGDAGSVPAERRRAKGRPARRARGSAGHSRPGARHRPGPAGTEGPSTGCRFCGPAAHSPRSRAAARTAAPRCCSPGLGTAASAGPSPPRSGSAALSPRPGAGRTEHSPAPGGDRRLRGVTFPSHVVHLRHLRHLGGRAVTQRGDGPGRHWREGGSGAGPAEPSPAVVRGSPDARSARAARPGPHEAPSIPSVTVAATRESLVRLEGTPRKARASASARLAGPFFGLC